MSPADLAGANPPKRWLAGRPAGSLTRSALGLLVEKKGAILTHPFIHTTDRQSFALTHTS